MKKKYFLLCCALVIGIGISVYYIHGMNHEKKVENKKIESTAEEKMEQVEKITTGAISTNATRILLVGNSQIYVNDMPATFWKLAQVMGDEAGIYILAKGASHLKDFTNVKNELGSVFESVLKEEEWDYVILQENTRYTSSNNIQKDSIPYVKTLDEKIKQNGAKTGFFVTWAPIHGMVSGGSITIQELQKIISNNYYKMAQEVNGIVFPIGDIFVKCSEKYPEIELWESDQSHSSKEGAYLTACVLYVSIFGKNIENCEYIGDLDSTVAKKIRKLVVDELLN